MCGVRSVYNLKAEDAVQALTLLEVRELQLDILRQVDRFCREKDIPYYLAWGTLLGAVRHGGYIPWDDDIDIMMHRRDYERFCRLFQHSGLTQRFSLLSFATHQEWNLGFVKISDDRTILRESYATTVLRGVNIDIFPIDVFPSSVMMRRLHRAVLRSLRGVVSLKAIRRRDTRATHKALTVRFIQTLLRRVTVSRVERVLSCYASANRLCSGKRAGVVSGPSIWEVESDALGEPIELEFEGISFLGPNDPSRVLRAMYGDYMTLPPEADRKGHTFEARWLEGKPERWPVSAATVCARKSEGPL
jgi:lipopolysaccharide cholinephosphotransferase